ncbi:hypothetical protein [Mesorhizobium amorphae]
MQKWPTARGITQDGNEPFGHDRHLRRDERFHFPGNQFIYAVEDRICVNNSHAQLFLSGGRLDGLFTRCAGQLSHRLMLFSSAEVFQQGTNLKMIDPRVEALCDEFEIRIVPKSAYPAPGETRAVGALAKIINRHRMEHARPVMTTLAETENNKLALKASAFGAASDLIRACPEWVEDASKWLAVWDRCPVGELQALTHELRGQVSVRGGRSPASSTSACGGHTGLVLSNPTFLTTGEGRDHRQGTNPVGVQAGQVVSRCHC